MSNILSIVFSFTIQASGNIFRVLIVNGSQKETLFEIRYKMRVILEMKEENNHNG